MTRPKVLLDPHGRRIAEIFADADLARLRELAEIVWARDEPMDVEDARRAMRDVVAVVTAGWRYGDVPDSPTLRAIIDVGGGFPPGLDYDACFARGIRVLTAAPAFARQVAEMALGLAIAACRDVVAADRAFRAGTEAWMHGSNEGSFMLFGQPVGMLGYGSIARRLHDLLRPFGCLVRAYDPWLGPRYMRSLGVEPVDLTELVASSRILFILAAPTAENRAVLDRTMLERVPQGGVVVLVSRAHVVDFDALTDLVLAGRFRAAIDVFPVEPLPASHPIRGAAGAILSAHRAGSVAAGLLEIGELVVDDVEAIVAGLPPQRLQVAAPELVTRALGR